MSLIYYSSKKKEICDYGKNKNTMMTGILSNIQPFLKEILSNLALKIKTVELALCNFSEKFFQERMMWWITWIQSLPGYTRIVV